MKFVFDRRRWSLCAAASAAVRHSACAFVMEEAEPRRMLAAPLTAVPILHSLPSASSKLFLDFNGDPGTPDWLGLFVPPTPAYDRDGDPKTFNDNELNNIRQIWARVAEKYSPFNLDVTTEDTGNRADHKTVQVVVGGSWQTWLGNPAGGVSPLGGFFTPGLPNTSFVFTEDGVDSVKATAEAIAHEAGHNFGLEHHSIWDPGFTMKTDEYDPGNKQSAPIMGVSYYSSRGLWAEGVNSSGVWQDDIAVLSGSADGFGFRPDEAGATQFSAAALTGKNETVAAKGVITTRNDVDVYSFTSPAGQVRFSVTPPGPGSMLDASIEIRDAFGAVIASSNTVNWAETVTATITAGTYYVFVSSAGGYGDVGQYELSGTLPKGVVGNTQNQLLVSGTDGDDVISITLEDGSYKLDVNGDVRTLDPSGIGQFSILCGAGNDKVTIGHGVTRCYMLGGDGNDTLYGGDANDTITASAGNDQLFGGEGDDRLAGGPGRDIIDGGNGRDRMYGDRGNDVMTGGAGVDRMWGGDDNDVLAGGSSADKMYGEYGNDSLYGGNGNDLLNGGVGIDQIYGDNDDDTIYSRDVNFDTIDGGSGNDKAQIDQTDNQDQATSIEELLA